MKYFDNNKRPHFHNEEAFYNKTGRKIIKLLESKGFVKSQIGGNLFDLKTIHNLFDYYKVIEKEDCYILKSFELQMMKKEQDCVVLKEHKYKIFYLSNVERFYNNKKIIWKHKIVNIDKEDVTILDSNCIVGQKFDLGLHIESFKKWGEHKMGYLAIPKEV